jgi:hypothetical protein
MPGAKGRFHRFTLTFPSVNQTLTVPDPFSDYQKLQELSAIEIVHRSAGR